MQLATLHAHLNYRTLYKQITCATLVIMADFLLYHKAMGWTLGLFGALMLLAMSAHNRLQANRHCTIALCAAAGLTLAPLESPTLLGGVMFVVTAIACVLLSRQSRLDDARTIAVDVWSYIFKGWFRLKRDSLLMAHLRKRMQLRHGKSRAFIRNWLLPLGLSAVFIKLFSLANPIVTAWLNHINWQLVTDHLSMQRLLLWLLVAAGCWALIRPRLKRGAFKKPPGLVLPVDPITFTSLIFNERSIFTSLILFNALFLMQNLMDVAFLWSGMELPVGTNHAQYAHQGAYPLIVTALLAALFVLIALKPGSVTEGIPVIRALVYGWVGQNVFLVMSAIMRLAGYIAEYSLTWLRVEAFIWMGLVALGLTLIVARIYFRKTNRWLINANCLSLYTTLYICCFVNFGGMIADYNVQHCVESGWGKCRLDVAYLSHEVGIDALPALRRLSQELPNVSSAYYANQLRGELETVLHYSRHDWRQWTFRTWRMKRDADPSADE